MDARTCLKKMQLAGTLSMATVNEHGAPQIRCVSAVHYEPDAIYFFTARGKEMTKQLMADGRLQTLVCTDTNEMIRMSGVARPAPDDEQRRWIDAIFAEYPFLADIYPGETRGIGIVFKVEKITLDYFNLNARPIERGTFSLDDAPVATHGYRITEDCIGCGTCQAVCPQSCIESGTPFGIEASHCLHCGACAQACPVGAVKNV